ncbi:MAG: transposase [Desulfovibrio sp.]|nr:transposase [Desulfovibrio sp.]
MLPPHQGVSFRSFKGLIILSPYIISPQYTSQTCSHCGCADRANRPTQAKFKCVACGFECNADHNAALNILAAGQAVSACGAGRAQAPALKQEPAYGVAR